MLMYAPEQEFSMLNTDQGRTALLTVMQQESMSVSTPAPITYFYCARSNAEPERAEPDEIFRSLLKQLLSHAGLDSMPSLSQAYKKREDEAEYDGGEIEKLSLEDCIVFILEYLRLGPVTIFVDALDECRPGTRVRLLRAFDQILNSSPNLVKLLVSSRDDTDLVLHLTGSPSVYICAENNNVDIELFIKTELDTRIGEKRLINGQVSPSLKSKIENALIGGAQGM